MHMDNSKPCFVLNCASCDEWFTYPRFTRLILGSCLIALGIVGISDGRYSDVSYVASVLIVVGILLASNACTGDFFQIKQVQFSSTGISLHWSYISVLWGQRIVQSTDIGWNEISQIEWREGALEVDSKQHLILHLINPLYRNRRIINILICDTHDFECCNQLLSNLPTHIKPPQWLLSRKKLESNENA